ncbi:hypothetical protein J1N35_005225 [Gossypium stocksii]|uniref:Uncharacterized protein n=1 Tax=Gossypium stocksii TaxID=47602 RepID=A0A9D3WEZ3_9ROSI|nr:hypothetical protein J1N35_005225 [Gossypium stocksii]
MALNMVRDMGNGNSEADEGILGGKDNDKVNKALGGNKANVKEMLKEGLGSNKVEAIGYSRGIWLGWKDSVRVDVVCSHHQFIVTRIWYMSSPTPIFISIVYGSPNQKKENDLWKDLRSSIPLEQILCIVVVSDFNAILSSIEKSGGLSNGRRCPHFSDFVDMAKVSNLDGFAQFRLICFYPVLYKLVMKLMWNGIPLSMFRPTKGI